MSRTLPASPRYGSTGEVIGQTVHVHRSRVAAVHLLTVRIIGAGTASPE